MRKYVNFNKLAWNRLIIRQYSQNNNKVSIKKDENDSSVTIRYRFYLTASKENKKFLENEFKINEDTIAKDVSNVKSN